MASVCTLAARGVASSYSLPVLSLLLLLAPLAVIATFKGGKKRRKYGYWLMLFLVVGVGTSVILTGCEPGTTQPPTPPILPPPTAPAPIPAIAPASTITPRPALLPTLPPALPPLYCTPVPPFSVKFPDKIILSVPHYSQLDTDYPGSACGPASLTMVLAYRGQEDSVDKVIGHLREIPPEKGGYDTECLANPVCTSPDALVDVAQKKYGLSVFSGEDWTLVTVKTLLSRVGSPIIADIHLDLQEGARGHFVVIYGYEVERAAGGAGDKVIIHYHDPYIKGAGQSADWIVEKDGKKTGFYPG